MSKSRSVFFGTSVALLGLSYVGQASAQSANQDMRVAISGHTDNVGEREKNVDLSQQRADAVKQYLVSRGVDQERIDTRGAGPDEPLAYNGQAAGRQKNRRIEFKLLSP